MPSETQKITFGKAARDWWKWISWGLFFILLLQLGIPIIYTSIRDAWISRISDDPNSFTIYLASTSQSIGLYYDIFKDAFLFGMIGYFGHALATNNKENLASSIRVVWFAIFGFMAISGLALNLIVLLRIDDGAFAQNIDEAMIADPSLNLDKDFLISQAAINYSILIWTQLFRMIATISFMMLAIGSKGKPKWPMIVIIATRVATLFAFDMLLFVPGISPFDMGALGVSTSSLIMQVVTATVSVVLVFYVFSLRPKMIFTKHKTIGSSIFVKNSLWSGFESLVRNAMFYIFILGSLNYLSPDAYSAWNYAAGVYWGLLLIPQVVIRETITKDIAGETDKKLARTKTMYAGHFFIGFITIFWLLFLPFVDNYLYWQTNGDVNTVISELSIRGFYIIFLPMVVYSFMSIWDIYFYSMNRIDLLFYRTIIGVITFYLPLLIYKFINPDFVTFDVSMWIFGLSMVHGAIVTYIFVLVYFRKYKFSVMASDLLINIDTKTINIPSVDDSDPLIKEARKNAISMSTKLGLSIAHYEYCLNKVIVNKKKIKAKYDKAFLNIIEYKFVLSKYEKLSGNVIDHSVNQEFFGLLDSFSKVVSS